MKITHIILIFQAFAATALYCYLWPMPYSHWLVLGLLGCAWTVTLANPPENT